MNPFSHFQTVVCGEIAALAAAGQLPAGLDLARISVEPPRDPSHGDIATNAAMVVAKPAGMKPRAIADLLAERLRAVADVTEVTVAGPGFVNLRLADDFWRARLGDVLAAGADYGASNIGNGARVNVEYVSANPTGPLHVGHARGTVVGDVLASLLEKVGYAVTREYYMNDAGAQVDVLARSAHLRYREALGEAIGEIPSGYYPGDYLQTVGAALADRDGDKWRGAAEADWLPVFREFAVVAIMADLRADLAAFGVRHDVFSSERALVEAGAVDAVIETLSAKGLIYIGTLEPPKGQLPEDWEPRPQMLFRATRFGDDIDRPLQKSDGSWTYFATDLAYHYDKIRRGTPTLIDVLGADHGGYVKRMQAGVAALSDGAAALDVKLCQLVRLLEDGQPAKMSKRAGTYVTLRDLLDRVGKDVVRFIMLTRKNGEPLDFDLAKVAEHSRDNPVFYVQYAHARCRSVLRLAAATFPDADFDRAALAATDLSALTDSESLGLIKLMAAWPRTVEGAAAAHEPHRLAFYLYDLAAGFHALWTKGKENTTLRFLVPEDRALTMARLALVEGTAIVVATGLRLMGVEPLEEL